MDAPETVDAGSSRRTRPLVLVTEDDEDTRFLFRTLLEMRGCSVIEATDGEEAVRLTERTSPDLILMDGSLPRLDGLSATRRIRQLRAVGRVPIVFVSGHAAAKDRAVAADAGCDEYLVKPLDLEQFSRMLDGCLGRHRAASTV